MDLFVEIVPFVAAAIGLLALSAFFTGTEVALLSLRRGQREQMGKSGRLDDTLALRLLERPRRLVVAARIGHEVVNGLLAVMVLEAVLAVTDTSVWMQAALTLAIALPAIVLLGEVVPRTIAVKDPVAWSRAAVRPLAVFALVVTPVRLVVQGIADLLLLPFGSVTRARPPRDVSEEEFRTLVDAGSAQGEVDARERRLIHRVFEFADKSVGQIMTPRDKIFALSFDLPMSRIIKDIAARGFSRVPIYQRSLDNIRGILNAKDLVCAAAGESPGRLADLLHEPLFVPRTTPIKRVFRIFKQKKVHMALVVNEYGKLLGLVTMDDVLAQLFGKLRDEREPLQTAVRRGRTPEPGAPAAVAAAAAVAEEAAQVAEAAESVARGEDVAPTQHEGDDVTPPAIDLPLDHEAGRAPDPDAPVPITDAATGPSGPIKTSADALEDR